MAKKERTKEKFSTELFIRFTETRAPEIREKLILTHQNLARFLAQKYANKGTPLEDIMQEASIGLINAVDRFDPSRGIRFATYATPTILGEIRRYFRDKGWQMKIPRRIQELVLEVNKELELLQRELLRSPSIQEISARLDASEEEVAEALALDNPISLETIVSDNEQVSSGIMDLVGGEDPNFAHFDVSSLIQDTLAQLPPNLSRVLVMRFFENLSQVEVARKLGYSQMYVSRLQAKALGMLRRIMKDEINTAIERNVVEPRQLESVWEKWALDS